jgi:hypothetical protein
MPQYVKIKNSKNLRFKLISLMYLIFLVLSVIQIPVGWLKVSPGIQTYIAKPKSIFQDSTLIQIEKTLNKVDNDFKVALGYNEVTGKIPEINSYSITDKFFIDDANANIVYDQLKKLNSWSEELPTTDIRRELYKKMFVKDLENGLSKNDQTQWSTYKWKHVPAVFARNMLEELKLRLKLLNTGPLEETETGEEPSFTLMTEYSSMRVGDEATLTTKGDTLISLEVLRNNIPTNDFKIDGNSFVITPQFAGTYVVNAKGLSKNESMIIEVLPAGFPSKEALPFRVCYKGVNYFQTIPFKGGDLTLSCSADPNASFTAATGRISFRPNNVGWCSIKLNQKEGLLFFDSVFVKPLPEPILQIKGLPNLAISRKRLLQIDKLVIEATHPSFEPGVFEVISYTKRSLGKITTISKINGNEISLDPTEKPFIKYLILYDVEVRMGVETQKIEQPIIIQIN